MKTRRLLLAALLLFMLARPASATAKPDTPPRPLKQVPPVSTEAMRTNPVYGGVMIEFDVDATGHVANATVVKSLSPDADQAALASLQQWIFEPAVKDGQPVAIHTRITIQFRPPPAGFASKVDTPARPLKQAAPVPTDAMRRSHLRGAVVIECIVDEKGRVTEAKVARSLTPDADGAALDCIQKWRFEPATKDGQPVKMRMVQSFQFSFN